MRGEEIDSAAGNAAGAVREGAPGRPLELARASGCSPMMLRRLRFGRAEACRRRMAAILAGLRLVTEKEVAITDIFSFDDGPLPAAKANWHYRRASGRPPKKQ